VEYEKPTTIRRFKELPRYEPLVKDSSVIMTFKTCQLKFFFRYVLGYTRQDNPAYFTFGTCYHYYREKLEIYYKQFSEAGEAKEDAVDMAYFLAAKDTLALWDKLAPDITPNPKFEFLNKGLLKDTMKYTWEKHWKKEKLTGAMTVVATEQPISVQITNGVREWWIGGRADQMVKWNGRFWGKDFKTSSKEDRWFVRGINPNHQFLFYTILEEIVHGQPLQGQIVEMMYNGEPPKKASTAPRGPEIYTHPVSYTTEEKELFKEELMGWLTLMDNAREADMYLKNESHCSFCEFHEVCQNSSDRGRVQTLKSKYQVKIWDFMNPNNGDV
jgi:hypothetical protein